LESRAEGEEGLPSHFVGKAIRVEHEDQLAVAEALNTALDLAE
jgi:hypothetical protein